MFTISEIKSLVKESTRKRLPQFEQNDVNQQLFIKKEVGFEAILTGNGDEKILLPEDGAFVYLFRGQNQEYVPCYPSLYRENPRPLTDCEIFIWRMRFVLFRSMLDTYPVVDRFFKRHNFKVDYEGLAQHYGLWTSVLDLTSNIDIALFFATCWYDKSEDCYKPFTDGKEHEGILYVFCPLFANEPSFRVEDFMKKNITPIGLQPFLRPARQKGYALHIPKGGSTKSWAYRFKFSNEDSLAYYNLFDEGKKLWISDILAEKTKKIASTTEFSYDAFARVYEEFRPKGISRTKLKKLLASEGIVLTKHAKGVYFSDDEKDEAVQKWNKGEGKLFCDTIGRRPWYEKVEASEVVSKEKKKQQIGPINLYRTFKILANKALLGLIASPEGPEGAEWINYRNTPKEPHRLPKKEDQEWKRVPGCFFNAFAERYLKEEDYLI